MTHPNGKTDYPEWSSPEKIADLKTRCRWPNCDCEDADCSELPDIPFMRRVEEYVIQHPILLLCGAWLGLYIVAYWLM